jgi:hypothetical protein
VSRVVRAALIRAASSACLGLITALVAPGVWAQTPSDVAAAEALFNEARKLEKAGDAVGACAKFEASYQLDAAPGTLLNVAECKRRGGRTATAWGQFLEAGRLFRRRGDDRRAAFADQKAAELEPTLARVRIVDPSARSGLVVRRDGVELATAALGTDLPVDPGPQKLVVEAPGYLPAEVPFEAAEGETREVVLPPLERAPEAPPAGPPARSPGDASSGDTLRTVGLVVGGVGVASLLAGGVFVGLTAERTSAADERCPDQICDAEGIAIVEQAETFANVANVTVIAGAALAAAGLGLWLFAPDGDDGAAVAATPWVGPGLGGVSLGGRF